MLAISESYPKNADNSSFGWLNGAGSDMPPPPASAEPSASRSFAAMGSSDAAELSGCTLNEGRPLETSSTRLNGYAGLGNAGCQRDACKLEEN